MMLYGSVTMDDFQFGWSDIDFCLLTERPISQELAETLVFLKQTMTEEKDPNPFFRLFEGVIMTKKDLLTPGEGKIVYWGTSGQRILSRFSLDPFTRMELIRDGIPVFGTDFRHLISPPDRAEIVQAIQRHYEAIRTYGEGPDRSCSYELYKIREDIGEQNNLADKYPKIVKRLERMLDDHLNRTQATIPVPNPNYDPSAVSPMGKQNRFPEDNYPCY